jgi:hypothetical protein
VSKFVSFSVLAAWEGLRLPMIDLFNAVDLFKGSVGVIGEFMSVPQVSEDAEWRLVAGEGFGEDGFQ